MNYVMCPMFQGKHVFNKVSVGDWEHPENLFCSDMSFSVIHFSTLESAMEPLRIEHSGIYNWPSLQEQ